MRIQYKVLIVLLIAFISCTIPRSTETYFGGWTEKPISFLNSISHVESQGGYFEKMEFFKWAGFDSVQTFQWIRNSDNILTVHQTIKELGYKRFISDSLFNTPMKFQDEFGGMRRHDWEDLSLSNIVDSLIDSYHHEKNDSNYFKLFWKRRVAEKNDQVLLSVLKEIKSIYAGTDGISYIDKTAITNDTLTNLLKYDLQLQEFKGNPSKEFLQIYFDYLRSIGLNHSAYNLVVEIYPGKMELDVVVQILKLDTVSANKYWETRNNARWIYSYRDNGP